MSYICLAVGVCLALPTFEPYATYHVGNSLTWNANPPAVAAIAEQAGYAGHSTGSHIRCGMSLNYIAMNPDETCLVSGPYGRWQEALADNTWTALTFQPYPGADSTGANSTVTSDAAAISLMVDDALTNPDNDGVQVYVYAAWPGKPLAGQTFVDLWNADTSSSSLTTLTRDHMAEVLAAVRAGDTRAERHALMIPAGDALAAIDVAMRSGEIQGFSSAADVYLDSNHMNNIGRFIAATTWFAVMYGEDPTGIAIPSGYFDDGQVITDDVRDQIQSIVWHVVREHPYAGVRAFACFEPWRKKIHAPLLRWPPR